MKVYICMICYSDLEITTINEKVVTTEEQAIEWKSQVPDDVDFWFDYEEHEVEEPTFDSSEMADKMRKAMGPHYGN